MKRNIKKMALAAMLAGMLGGLTGCFIQPDPTLDPLQISDGTVPFGTVQALPTNTPTPVPQNTPTPTPDTWQSSDQSTWEDWSGGSLPTTTPKTAATVAPGAQSWQTSTQDYNAGYPVLRVGSTGSDVSDLQARLTELGYYTGTIDGKYSTGTQSAVTEFQSRNGLTADGIAGRATQDKLYSASAQPKTVSASAADSGYTLLKEGASGLEVRKLQGRLAELGYYAGGVDGIYGSTTTSAVKAFQRANGLSGDGQAGSQTQTKLYSASAKYAASPVATANPDQTRTLTVGMTGNDVYALQERLIELNYLSGVADGVFGAETQNALTAFQSRNGLTADGTAGASTLKKLNGSCKPAAATAEPSGNGTMREGDTGEDVYTLQARLFELGYYNGRIDGRYSSETTAAVKAFQKANGLSADGIAGQGTLNKLNSGNAVVSDGTTDDVTGDETWRKRAGRIIEHVLGWAKANNWRIPEHFHSDWSLDLECNREKPDDQFKPYGATPGHGIEWARLITQWATSTYPSDPAAASPYIDAAEHLFNRAVEDAWNADGAPGLVYTTDWDGKPVVHDRMHWTLAEGINTSSTLARVTGKESYAKWYATFLEYADSTVMDHVNGSWFHQLDRTNQPIGTVWPGKSDLYHATQSMMIPLRDPSLSIAPAARKQG